MSLSVSLVECYEPGGRLKRNNGLSPHKALIGILKFEKSIEGTQNGYQNTRQTKKNTITYH